LGFVLISQNKTEPLNPATVVEQPSVQKKSERTIANPGDLVDSANSKAKRSAVNQNIDQRSGNTAIQKARQPTSEKKATKPISRAQRTRQVQELDSKPQTLKNIDTTYGETESHNRDAIKGRNKTQIQTDYNGL
jgi:hypothetical protein